jgi:hypothetical protein
MQILALCIDSIVVVLRSKAQAQALAGVLTDNPVLGKLIHKLRLEDGYAISMFKMLQAAPNISDIFLTLNITTPDNVCGLCRGLQLIQPIRIIIFGTRGSPYHIQYPERRKLVQKLVAKFLLSRTRLVLQLFSILVLRTLTHNY